MATQGGGTPDLTNALQMQTSMVNSILRRYHVNYVTEKIKVDRKKAEIYFITKIFCDEGYEYICERIAEQYAVQAMQQNKNNVELKAGDENGESSK